MKSIIFISIFCIVLSCNNRPASQTAKSRESKKAFRAKAGIDAQIGVLGTISKNNSVPKQLLGMWSDSIGGNVTFIISQKTFFYPDQAGTYKYKIVGDSINIYYSDFNESFAYRFKGNDTLVMTGPDGENLFYRK